MAMKAVVPMVGPIAIGANGCVSLAPMVIAILMEPIEPPDGDVPFTITTKSEWMFGIPLAPIMPVLPMAIHNHRRQWSQSENNNAGSLVVHFQWQLQR